VSSTEDKANSLQKRFEQVIRARKIEHLFVGKTLGRSANEIGLSQGKLAEKIRANDITLKIEHILVGKALGNQIMHEDQYRRLKDCHGQRTTKIHQIDS
jgi:hypothetical protein